MKTFIRPTDQELAELLTLQAQLKVMNKRIEEIKKKCKECGSFYTALYTVSIISRTRVGLAGLDEVKEYIHEDILNQYGLIRTTDYQLVEIGKLPEMPLSTGHFRKPATSK